MHQSNINVQISLDEQKIPQQIQWSASDSSAEEAQAARAMMLTFWDPTDKTAGQYGGVFDKRLDQYPVGQSTPTMTINNKPYVNPNAKTPTPMNKGESTFLGAVGEYFNNAQKNTVVDEEFIDLIEN